MQTKVHFYRHRMPSGSYLLQWRAWITWLAMKLTCYKFAHCNVEVDGTIYDASPIDGSTVGTIDQWPISDASFTITEDGDASIVEGICHDYGKWSTRSGLIIDFCRHFIRRIGFDVPVYNCVTYCETVVMEYVNSYKPETNLLTPYELYEELEDALDIQEEMSNGK